MEAMQASPSLADRIRVAAQLAQGAGHERAVFEERSPGVKTRILRACPHRGPVRIFREIPCCGHKVRREEQFDCSHPANEFKNAWGQLCQACRLAPVSVPA